MKNKKGFTLIELLAVIIILGILMIIAIPSVTRYISDSRKSAYVDTAKEIVGGARNLVNDGKLEMYDTSVAYYIPNTCIKVENGNKAKSPYGEFIDDKTYVVVTYDGKGYSYYWVSLDDTGTGVKEPISIDKLEEKDIETDLTRDDVKDNNGVGKEKVVIFSSTCDGKTEKDAYSDLIVSTILNEKESQLRKIDENVYIFKGGNPDNYVRFNCDSNNNCETWRIIGIYEDKLKIIKTDSISSQIYKNSNSIASWEGSQIETYLNKETEGGYFYSLNQSAKELITTGTWFVGTTSHNNKAAETYEQAKSLTLSRKIGLITVYEFLYATGTELCLSQSPGYYYNINNCGTSGYNWLKPSLPSWTISHLIDYTNYVLVILGNGSVNKSELTSRSDIIPAVFLNYSVKITGGSGTSSDPYTLGL